MSLTSDTNQAVPASQRATLDSPEAVKTLEQPKHQARRQFDAQPPQAAHAEAPGNGLGGLTL